MEAEKEIIGQISLILTQLHSTRRAIEEIERSTARYGGIPFTSALAAGTSFGAPPLVDGALKVYVVNISDLTTGGGLGGFLEGLLGGVGRFFGGLFGGLIGGTISGVALPVILVELASIADTVERIVSRLGISGGSPKSDTGQEKKEGSSGILSIDLIRALTELFRAASSGPETATKGMSSPQTSDQWVKISGILTGVSHVLEGLIIALPLLIGTLAEIIKQFNTIKETILDLLQFVFRNIFLLRGVILVTIYDTIASAAKLVSNILSILGVAVTQILNAVFKVISELLQAALEILRFIGTGLQQTVNTLLQWLVGPLSAALGFLADLRIFRLIAHLVQMLPQIIVAINQITSGKELSDKDIKALTQPQPDIFAPTTGVGRSSIALPPLNLADALGSVGDLLSLQTEVQKRTKEASHQLGNVFAGARKGLEGVERAVNEANVSGEAGFTFAVGTRIESLNAQADVLAESLVKARDAAAKKPETGLEAIASAYEKWLGAGGLTMVLGTITEYFRRTPTAGPAAAESLPGQIVSNTKKEEPLATVEIGEVLIEVEPPAVGPMSSAGPISDAFVEELLQRIHELQYEYQMRGYRLGQGAPLAFS